MCAMKVGTDAVLLGAWAGRDIAPRSVLDIGSGSGIISLMAAQRFPDARITAVDVMAECAAQTRANADASPWGSRIAVGQSAVQQYAPEGRFDLVISNPPYFDSAVASPDSARRVARQSDMLPLEDLDAAVGRLLADEGRFAVVLPPAAARRLCFITRLWLVRRCDVASHRNAGTKRCLMEFARRMPERVEHTALRLHDETGARSADYRRLTADFYL